MKALFQGNWMDVVFKRTKEVALRDGAKEIIVGKYDTDGRRYCYFVTNHRLDISASGPTREDATREFINRLDRALNIMKEPRYGLEQEHYDLFMKVHRTHMKAMGTDHQKRYALENVRRVVWDERDQCIKVYYDTDWWNYDRRGVWY